MIQKEEERMRKLIGYERFIYDSNINALNLHELQAQFYILGFLGIYLAVFMTWNENFWYRLFLIVISLLYAIFQYKYYVKKRNRFVKSIVKSEIKLRDYYDKLLNFK